MYPEKIIFYPAGFGWTQAAVWDGEYTCTHSRYTRTHIEFTLTHAAVQCSTPSGTYMTQSSASLNIPLHDKFHLISCLTRKTDIGRLKCKYVCVRTSNLYVHSKGNAYKLTRTYKTWGIFSKTVTLILFSWCVPWIKLFMSMFFFL